MIKSPDNSLIKLVYNMLRNDINNNNTYSNNNWAYHIHTLLNNLGMTNLWLNQDTLPIDIMPIKQRIIDNCTQSWCAQINNLPKLCSYSLFKHDFNQETYLSCISENKFRIALCKLRTSSHDLQIEVGRYTNIPRQERICINCNMRVVENEYHLLLVCPKHRELRNKYLNNYYCRWQTLTKFENLMISKSPKILVNLSKFVYFAFHNRI